MPQFLVNQGPRFEKSKPVRRENQVLSRQGLIRPDKRKRARFI